MSTMGQLNITGNTPPIRPGKPSCHTCLVVQTVVSNVSAFSPKNILRIIFLAFR